MDDGNGQHDDRDGMRARRDPDAPDEEFQSAVQSGLTLERIVDLTGEFEHLNELIVLHIDHAGGYCGPEAYFRTVQPVLDLLEVEIRVRYCAGMTRRDMKLIVQDWIDQEIAGLHEDKRPESV